MKRGYIFVKIYLLLILFSSQLIHAEVVHIKEIFIEAYGNNQYEAKIKANHLGMKKAFTILWDKKGLPYDPLKKNINYSELKTIFKIDKVQDENLSDKTYEASVDYIYDISQFYKLIFSKQLEKPILENIIYQNLIFAIEKKNDILSFDKNFYQFCEKTYPEFVQNKQVFLSKELNDFAKDPIENILAINHKKLEAIFPKILFKNIVFITYEIFTNRSDMSYHLSIEYKKRDYNNNISYKKFFHKLQDKIISEDKIFKIIFEHFIQNFTTRLKNTPKVQDKQPMQNQNKDSTTNDKPQPNLQINNNPLELIFNTENPKTLEQVEQKLSQLKLSIHGFTVKKSSKEKNTYIFILNLKQGLFELSEEFYNVNLSYAKQNEEYFLINLTKGI